MSSVYNYLNVSAYIPLLDSQLKNSGIPNYTHVSYFGQDLQVYFSESLGIEDKESLDVLIQDHSLNHTSTFDYNFESSKVSQEQNIHFGQSLLHDWMRRNTLEGMSVNQSLWVFSRFEEFTVNAIFGTKHVDLFKMFQSGAIPTVYYCILRVTPDDMTQSYHWLTQERINWVKERLENFLGAGMVAYIQSLD
jgi:hypothetical protein